MKKISLVLVIAMLACSLFAINVVADESAATYSYRNPEVTYSNLSYTDGLCLMFAVPVDSALPEGAKVSLLVWPDHELTENFSYNDVESGSAIEVAPEETKATIGGVEHYVFKYDGLTAEMMTDVIYARPIVISGDTRYYGEVFSHSAVKYVKAALGELEGYSGLADESIKALLRSFLDFGATAQTYLGGDEPYAPNGYLANDTLSVIKIIPVVEGVEGAPLFGGFFKAGEDNFASLYPVIDSVNVVGGFYDLDGVLLEDEDRDLPGLQVSAPAEGDLVVKMVYTPNYIMKTNFANASDDSKIINSIERGASKGVNITGAGLRVNTSNGDVSKYEYHAYDVVDDPYGSGAKVLRWTATNGGALYFSDTSMNRKINTNGFGDTAGSCVTVNIEMAAGPDGTFPTRGSLRVRSSAVGDAAKVDQNVFSVGANGEIKFYGYTDVKHTLSNQGWNKFSVVMDFEAVTISLYVEENGVMVQKATETMILDKYEAVAKATTATGFETPLNWVKYRNQNIEWYAGTSADKFSATEKNATVEIGGEIVPITNSDGSVNAAAMVKYCEQTKSIFIKEMSIIAGNPFAD